MGADHVQELFQRLAQGHAARICMVTPNRRLAQALRRDFDRAQLGRGLSAWETADILPFNAFLERLWEDALYSDSVPELPLLLTPAQEQTVWEDVVHGSKLAEALLSVSGTASQCRDAWQLAHAWGLMAKISKAGMNEDAEAFVEWAARYARALEERGQIDAALLPDALIPLLPLVGLNKPKCLVLFGFDSVTPQQRAVLEALAVLGVEVTEQHAPQVPSQARRVEFTSAKDEVLSAARWARAKLEAGGAEVRIGVVVPDLSQSRALVQRTFASVMRPASLLPVGVVSVADVAGAPGLGGASAAAANTNVTLVKPALPFDLSLGLPLSDFPLVHDALLVLELACDELPFEAVSRLIRSPFLAGAQSELAVRARVDFELRRRCGVTLTLDRLVRAVAVDSVPHASVLAEFLSRLSALSRSALPGSRLAAEWAQVFAEVLKAVGFPGERTLDSTEYQTLKKWHDVLAAFAALERVTGKMSCAQAFQRLRRLAGDTLFQPETPQAPVQVLGVLESTGLTFDHLWVMGLTDDAWPLPARPNPFVPIRLQREAGIPYADAAASLERGRRMTQDWLSAAPEVIVSHARMRDDSELAPSPLIAAVEAVKFETLAVLTYETLRAAIHRGLRLESIEDGVGPALTAMEPFAGGTAVFKDQAACPFRAFAHHRLDSRPPEIPRAGLNAAERGTLLHDMLAEVWAALGDKQKLDTLPDDALAGLLEQCAVKAVGNLQRRRPDVLNERFAAAERVRLSDLAYEWLALEKTRPDFRVTAIERKRPVTFGGVTVNAKLDRMDTLATGERVVIDYKTGRSAVSAWLGGRPDEPQLPMYALGVGEQVDAVAFAQLKVGELRFRGLASTEGLLPGVTTVAKDRSRLSKHYASWADVVRGWQAELESLGRGFAVGDARVDPKQGAITCQYCDQHAFCRVAEKTLAPVEEEGGDE